MPNCHQQRQETDMTSRSTLDPDNFPASPQPKLPKGHDIRSLGPSDSSDSGSDMADAAVGMDDNSDRDGTGERGAAGKEPATRIDGDYDTDRIVDAEEAGLGGGLDQAEEAQLGITDEEIQRQSGHKTHQAGKEK
jgi:hypothetical protein